MSDAAHAAGGRDEAGVRRRFRLGVGGWGDLGIRVRLGLALALALSPVLLLGLTGGVLGFRQAAADQRADLAAAASRAGAGITLYPPLHGRRPESPAPQVGVSPAAGLPPDTEVGLLNAEGRLVAGPGVAPPGLAQRAPAAQRDVTTLEWAAPDGGRRLYAAAPLTSDPVLRNAGWRVLLSTPVQTPWSYARLNALGAIGLPLLAFALALGSVWVIADRVVIRWLQYLQRVAAIYARGRFTVRPDEAAAAAPELRSLAGALDAMAEAIEARDASLQGALGRQDALMREIHHRVKNNLQVITSLLNLQQRGLRDPAAQEAVSDTRQRITALSLIYKVLYQGADLRQVDLGAFLQELLPALTGADLGQGRIRSRVEYEPLAVDPDRLAPLALYTVEAVTNARKHAFDEAGGEIVVALRVSGETAVLEVRDNGGGMAEGAPRGVGVTLMTAFARQLRGASELIANPVGGMINRLTFPAPRLSEQAGALEAA